MRPRYRAKVWRDEVGVYCRDRLIKVEHEWFYVVSVEYDGMELMYQRGRGPEWDTTLAYVNRMLALDPLNERELAEWVDRIRSRENPTPTK